MTKPDHRRTNKQKLGDWGEQLVAKCCPCPQCEITGTFRLLKAGSKCIDLTCSECGLSAQVKAKTVKDVERLPSKILGAAWDPQKALLDKGIYVALYVVLTTPERSASSIFHLPSEAQSLELFEPRKPLKDTAKRAGWQGFNYVCRAVEGRFKRIAVGEDVIFCPAI